MPKPVNVLIVDDENDFREILSEFIRRMGYNPVCAENGIKALKLIKELDFDLAIIDYSMPQLNGLELLKMMKMQSPQTRILFVTGYSNLPSVTQITNLDVVGYITKPLDLKEVEHLIKRIVSSPNVKDESQRARLKGIIPKKHKFQNIIGATPQMQEIFKIIERVSQNNSTVLIQGESGTGKELIAKAIHFSAPNADKPFIPIDCGSINENLVESELFGHEKGAFTGAYSAKKGLFLIAHGGTLFFDEIGEIPREVQAKLLRSLQERRIKTVGGTEFIDIDVRVIAATNRNLDEAIKDGEFRKDLFYRLNVVSIQVPPLREREEDIPLLVDHFIKRFHYLNPKITGISQKALKILLDYPWPGNVRELENIIERAFALGNRELITVNDLPTAIVERRRLKTTEGIEELKSLQEIEKETILKTLEKMGGDKVETARILKIDRSTLYRKLRKYSLT